MKISKYDGSRVRLILIGMITDAKVCNRVCSIMSTHRDVRFDDPASDLIVKWCKDYFAKYGAPPGDHIKIIFRRWAETEATDKSVVSQIEDLLAYLSDEYVSSTKQSSEYILSLATEHFNTHLIKSQINEIEDDVRSGHVHDAIKRMHSTPQIDFSTVSSIKVLEDTELWLEVFNDEHVEPIIEYPGALGELVGQSLTRGSLFSIMGIDKAGKSYYLLDAAYRALKKRHRVAYFEVGDLGRNETIQRLGQRILHETLESNVLVKWPVDWDDKDIPITEVRHKRGVSIGHALKRSRKYTRGRHLLKLSVHTNSSINVAGIESYLQDWARVECWLPDVVIIDYADILAPPDNYTDSKDQIDETWKQLRRLSQTYNCLVLTATQTGAQAYKKGGRVITRTDFGGRKTKLAHVNGMLGLTATAEDMKHCVTRLNWTVRRKGGGSESIQVLVAGCFEAGMPIILSKFPQYYSATTTASTSHEDNNG